MRKKIIILLVAISIIISVLVIYETTFAQSAVKAGDIVVQTIPGPTLAQKLVERAQNSWPWYIVRGSGIVAALSLFVLMLSGVGLVTGHTFKFLEPIIAWASHRALGIVFGISIMIHMVGLLFDRFVPFGIINLLVPWSSSYKPVNLLGFNLGSIYISIGVLAFYGVVLIVITSLLLKDKKPLLWKLTHLLSYLVMAFVFIHALYLGTDLASGFLRYLWIGMGLLIACAGLYRLWRARTI